MLAAVFGVVVLLVAIDEEPFHIDEIRQVSSYHLPLVEVMRASIGQEQPPLDAWIGALSQRLGGQSDLVQRAPSVLWGVGSLALLARLLLRSGLRAGAVVAVLGFAASPVIVNVTAYARPYALPTFLMLAFITAANAWLERRSRGALAAMVLVAGLLPAARITEPIVFLASTAAVLWWWQRRRAAAGSARVPMAAAFGGIVLVGLPYSRLLYPELSKSTTDHLTSVAQLGRVFTEFGPVLVSATPGWWALMPALAATALLSDGRKRLLGLWWWWVLLLVPVVFNLVFLAHTKPSQTYFERYTFTLWLPIAVALGAGIDAAIARRRERGALAWIVIGGCGLFLAASLLQLRTDLTNTERPDWRSFSEFITRHTEPGTTILFEHVAPAADWRLRFAGGPRYLPAEWSAPSFSEILQRSRAVHHDASIAVALIFAGPEVSGWTRLPHGRYFSLYVRQSPLRGPSGAAQALEEFAARPGSRSRRGGVVDGGPAARSRGSAVPRQG